ncbi:MAG TPA: OmpA family protein, partial [Saprospiraceae bacterium]|nr:OmpA family protein [Saprospiraceae bacterium]
TSRPVILKNVFFETASAALRQESVAELTRLKKLLEAHPQMNIQINGHTDNVGSDADNQVLSTNRAKAVYDFLIKNGIAPARLAYKGFGESQPIDTNDTAAGRQNNRRTEFVVLR